MAVMLGNWLYLIFVAPFIFVCIALAARHFARMYGPDGWRRWFVAQRESGRLFIVMGIVVPLLYLGFIASMSMYFGGSVLIRLLGQLPTACMLAAFQFLGLARRPVGDELRCSKCKYALAGLAPGSASGPNGRHDARCPECGGQWGWPGGSVSTRKRWSRRWIVVATILFVPMILWFASIPVKGVLWWNRALLVVAPTSSLVEEVLTQKSFTMDAWAELSRRTLSEVHRSRIAIALFSRADGAYWSPDERAWMTKELTSRRIDAKLVRERLLARVEGVSLGRDPHTGKTRLEMSLGAGEKSGPFVGLYVGVHATTKPESDEFGRTMLLGSNQGGGTVIVPIDDHSARRVFVRFALLPSGAAWPGHRPDGSTVLDTAAVLYEADREIDVPGPWK